MTAFAAEEKSEERMEEALYTGAFVTGLFGSGHCMGMCGGIVAALSLQGARRAGFLFHVLYHLGRITTYVGIGTLSAWAAMSATDSQALRSSTRWLLIVADVFVIGVGLASLINWQRFGLMRLELPAAARAMTGAVRSLRRLPPSISALPLGLIFGFLPCGFLYAMVMNAALTTRPASAAVMMVLFGLGTAPSLLAFGGVTQFLTQRARGSLLRGAGAVVALLGVLNLVRHWSFLGGHH